MDKKLRNAVIAGIIIIVASAVYYFVFKPAPKTEFESCYEACTGLTPTKGLKIIPNQRCVLMCGNR